MGSITSKIHDDVQEYHSLCSQYNEKYVDVYSVHYYWLNAKHNESNSLTFEEYKRQSEKETLLKLIEKKERELSKLREDLSNL